VRAVLLVGAVIVAIALIPSSAASGRQKPYVLTALADIGTVYWRYDCVHYRTSEWSLGVHVFQTTATTSVTFRAGKLTMHRPAIQPGERTLWFPFRRERRQSLLLVQATEPGTLRARVRAKFSRRDCQSYFPPRLSVQLYPR
jgi:hypothetical protein